MRLGLYSEYLEDWFSVFQWEQILVVRMEDYSQDRLQVLNKVYRHLNIGKWIVLQRVRPLLSWSEAVGVREKSKEQISNQLFAVLIYVTK